MSPETNLTDYELLVVFSGDLKESEMKAGVEKLRKEIEKLGAIKNETLWLARPLAYQIGKDTTGTYFVVNFGGASEKIPEFENIVRLEPAIIRHVIIKTPKHYVWRDYTTEELDHDFTKFNRKLFEEAAPKKFEKISGTKTPRAPARSAPLGAPAKSVKQEEAPNMKERPKAKKAKSKDEVEKKLDSILDEL